MFWANMIFSPNPRTPEFREDVSAEEIKEWSSLMTWENLEILETSAGGPEDETGEVSFCAHYSVQGYAAGIA